MTSSRIPALVLLILAAALAAAAVALPLRQAIDLRRDIAAADDRLSRIKSAVGDGQHIAQLTSTSLLVSEGSPGRASADLQTRLGSAARTEGIVFRSTQVLESRRQGDVTEISVEVAFQTGATALRGLLHDIETRAPLLIVDEIAIRAVQPASGEVKLPSVPLDVTMKVRGFAPARERP